MGKRPWPPYIPPYLHWKIPGLLQEGSPVVDTSKSAQWGYRGTVLVYNYSLHVFWHIPAVDREEPTDAWMMTSITGGSGLNLSLRRGRDRAVEWVAERVLDHANIDNRYATAPWFTPRQHITPRERGWHLQIIPGVAVEFAAVPASRNPGSVALFVVPGLVDCESPHRFDDGGRVVDAMALKTIVEWVVDHSDEFRAALEDG